MDEKWSTAAIRIFSESLSPKEICNILNIKESRSFSKGEPINKRKPDGPKRNETLWILKSSIDQSMSLDFHIKELIEIIENKIDAFRLIVPNCAIEISCGFSSGNGQGGFVIEFGLLKRLTIIPIDISLDLYPPISNEVD